MFTTIQVKSTPEDEKNSEKSGHPSKELIFSLPNKSKFIRYDASQIELLNKESKCIKVEDLSYSLEAKISQVAFSDTYFACLVTHKGSQDELNESYYYSQDLYIYDNNLKRIGLVGLEDGTDFRGDDLAGITRPSKLEIIALSTDHVAVTKRKIKRDGESLAGYGARFKDHLDVLVFDLEGKFIRKFELDPRVFVAPLPDGRIAIHDREGNITAKKIFPAHEVEIDCGLPLCTIL